MNWIELNLLSDPSLRLDGNKTNKGNIVEAIANIFWFRLIFTAKPVRELFVIIVTISSVFESRHLPGQPGLWFCRVEKHRQFKIVSTVTLHLFLSRMLATGHTWLRRNTCLTVHLFIERYLPPTLCAPDWPVNAFSPPFFKVSSVHPLRGPICTWWQRNELQGKAETHISTQHYQQTHQPSKSNTRQHWLSLAKHDDAPPANQPKRRYRVTQ